MERHIIDSDADGEGLFTIIERDNRWEVSGSHSACHLTERHLYVRTFANVESTGSTSPTGQVVTNSFPGTLSVSPIFSEDFTLHIHLLVASTSIDGVLQVNSGRCGTASNFLARPGWPSGSLSICACGCAYVVVRWSRSRTVSHYYCVVSAFSLAYARRWECGWTSARKCDPKTWTGEKITEQTAESLTDRTSSESSGVAVCSRLVFPLRSL